MKTICSVILIFFTVAVSGGRAAPASEHPLVCGGRNFEWDKRMYDGADWSGRRVGQPFFMQVQLPGGKLRGETTASARALAERARRELGSATEPGQVQLPPYYPRDPVLLEDWAAYLDTVRFTDRHVGEVMSWLQAEGMKEWEKQGK